jgi:hypothetical protein
VRPNIWWGWSVRCITQNQLLRSVRGVSRDADITRTNTVIFERRTKLAPRPSKQVFQDKQSPGLTLDHNADSQVEVEIVKQTMQRLVALRGCAGELIYSLAVLFLVA